MCDTVLATPNSTLNRVMLFGKNSDRQRNEAHVVEFGPAGNHPCGAQMKCTYISVGQSRRTHATLICRPFWMWGAEMGANEHGVVVGNEALHARGHSPGTEALTGMDLVRLGLERGATAGEAVEVITSLLKEYGQGGNCGHLTPAYYYNGFMIADAREGFVLETIGREWMLERVRDYRAISNCYSIGHEACEVSEGFVDLLSGQTYEGAGRGTYADLIADHDKEKVSQAVVRRGRATDLLYSDRGNLHCLDFMRVLRDHGADRTTHDCWSPATSKGTGLCVHAGAAHRRGQTTGSLISEIRDNQAIHWVTATAAPCTSIFKPVLFGVELPSHALHPNGKFDASALWWRHELLHRAALLGEFSQFISSIVQERSELETKFYSAVSDVLEGGSGQDKLRVVSDCWREAVETEERWFTQLACNGSSREGEYFDGWSEMNREAGIESSISTRNSCQ